MEKSLDEIRKHWREYPKLADRPKCPVCGVPAILDLAKGDLTYRVEVERLISA